MGERLTRFFGVFAGDPFPFKLRRKNKHLSKRTDDEKAIEKSKVPRFKTLFRKNP